MIEVTPMAAPVNFAPNTVVEEVLQNVATLLSTIRYTVPYDRMLGINPNYLDDPSPVTRARLTADILETIQKYEPRAKVIEILFKEDQREGILVPTVRMDVNE